MEFKFSIFYMDIWIYGYMDMDIWIYGYGYMDMDIWIWIYLTM
jgi:hypothetical protein